MLYVDGFKGLGGLGKALWALIAVKLVLMFVVLKLFLLKVIKHFMKVNNLHHQ